MCVLCIHVHNLIGNLVAQNRLLRAVSTVCMLYRHDRGPLAGGRGNQNRICHYL